MTTISPTIPMSRVTMLAVDRAAGVARSIEALYPRPASAGIGRTGETTPSDGMSRRGSILSTDRDPARGPRRRPLGWINGVLNTHQLEAPHGSAHLAAGRH